MSTFWAITFQVFPGFYECQFIDPISIKKGQYFSEQKIWEIAKHSNKLLKIET